MQFPLTSTEIMLWLGITAILLLVTSELLSPYYGQTSILLEQRKVRQITLVFTMLFLLMALTQIYAIFTF